MSSIVFDTLQFAERLRKAGVPADQAIAIVEAQKEAFTVAMDTSLASQSDLRDVRRDIRDLRAELKADVTALKADVTALDIRLSARFDKVSWMLGVVIALALANFGRQFF